MEKSDACVYIVDDDELIRDSLKQLVKSVGLDTMIFSSAQNFLDIHKLQIQIQGLLLI